MIYNLQYGMGPAGWIEMFCFALILDIKEISQRSYRVPFEIEYVLSKDFLFGNPFVDLLRFVVKAWFIGVVKKLRDRVIGNKCFLGFRT